MPALIKEISLTGFGLLSLTPFTEEIGFKDASSSESTWIDPGLSPAAPPNLMTDPGTELFPAVTSERSAFPEDAKAPALALACAEAKAPAELWNPAAPEDAEFRRQHTCSALQN